MGGDHSSSITFPFQELREVVDEVSTRLSSDRREVLEALGTELLKLAREAYLVKARGGTGSDGIKWDAIQLRSLRRRQRRGSTPVKTDAGTRTRLTNRADNQTKRIAPSDGNYEIGRDTDRLLNSLQPGSGQNMTLEETAVVVRSGTAYSDYFGKSRPILPETVPAEWRDGLEELLQLQALSSIENVLGKTSNT